MSFAFFLVRLTEALYRVMSDVVDDPWMAFILTGVAVTGHGILSGFGLGGFVSNCLMTLTGFLGFCVLVAALVIESPDLFGERELQ